MLRTYHVRILTCVVCDRHLSEFGGSEALHSWTRATHSTVFIATSVFSLSMKNRRHVRHVPREGSLPTTCAHIIARKNALWRFAEQIVFIVHIDVRFSWSAEPKHVQQTKYNRGDYRPGNGCIGTIVEKTAYWKVKASSQCARYIVLLPGLVLQFGGQCWRNRRSFSFYFLEFWRR